MTASVVIPVKAFAAAKVRLAPALSPDERADLARSMAEQVVRAAGSMPVLVVCDDPAVRAWATGLGDDRAARHEIDTATAPDIAVCWTPGLGLDGAVEAGVARAAGNGADRVVVAHADLPMAVGLDHVVGTDGTVLVPDRRADGTNVIAIPARCGFRFAYGPGSFERHRREAQRLGLAVTVVDDAALGWDVDLPDDLDLPGGRSLRAEVRP